MRKFFIYSLLIGSALVWTKNFVRSGKFDAFLVAHPQPAVTPRVYYMEAQLFYWNGQYERAQVFLTRILKEFPKSTLVTDASYQHALCYEKLQNKAEAAREYQEFLEKHPDSPRADLVRKSLEFLN